MIDLRTDASLPGFAIETTKSPITITPTETALVIVDMQNFFLHPSLREHTPGIKAEKVLSQVLIPACRKAGMYIIYCNWGLTDETIPGLPPAVNRLFDMHKTGPIPAGKKKLYIGFGNDMGEFDGIQAGRMLYKDAWNSDVYGDLKTDWETHKSEPTTLWFHKERMSGLGAPTELSPSPSVAGRIFEEKLQELGIKTLLFAGVNTDQCVFGTLLDAYNRGFETVMVPDACGTTSPDYVTDSILYNVAGCYGFVSDSDQICSGLAA